MAKQKKPKRVPKAPELLVHGAPNADQIWDEGDVQVQFADNVVVRFHDGAFELIFFKQKVPIVAGIQGQITQQVAKAIENRCLSHIVMSETKMAELIEALGRTAQAIRQQRTGQQQVRLLGNAGS
jgi:hypothetical protein